jgi:hypothetical protein
MSRFPLVIAIGVLALAGCDQLDRNGALVNVFAIHHASPEDDTFPDRGADDQPRIFQGEDGWEITLAESYVTIASVELVSCSGSSYDLKMFWGPCPEDLREKDLQTLTVAGLKVPADDYCRLEVEYAPYETPVIDEEADTRHVIPQNEEVDGVAVFISGIAKRGEDSVPFVLKNGESFTVDLDLSEIEGPGNPMTVTNTEDFPKELTISKTYDRFFDGIDFTNFDEEALERELDDILAEETRVIAGTTIFPDDID